MATPSTNIKSAARKLPIKRKTPPTQPLPSSDPDSDPIAPNSIVSLSTPKPEPYASTASENGYDDEYDDDDDEEAEEEEEEFGDEIGGAVVPVSSAGGGGGDDLKPPPFKFHRIWSESDEIRFLQGLLGCWSQGMMFPRDLNLFYDRFSESMPQPYTRSQLSEKLRRLRKKFRTMSGRIARGQDPNRLAPHDRDLFHLCTRLWHPSYAASSPFSAPEGATPPVGNKRRRPNPRTPSGRTAPPAVAPVATPPPQLQLPSHPHPHPPPSAPPPALSDPLPAALPAPPIVPEDGNSTDNPHPGPINEDEKKPLPLPLPLPPPTCPPASGGPPASGAGKEGTMHMLAKSVLDVFDGTLIELRNTVFSNGMLQSDTTSSSSSIGSNFSKRWQELRLEEMDVLGRRLRLVIEDSIRG